MSEESKEKAGDATKKTMSASSETTISCIPLQQVVDMDPVPVEAADPNEDEDPVVVDAEIKIATTARPRRNNCGL